MWIIAREGFISIVADRDDPEDSVHVRARVRSDLETWFPEAKIINKPNADYAWHATVPRAEAEMAVALAIENVNYTSHAKEEMAPIGRTDDGAAADRYSVYLNVWTALLRLQER